MFTSNRIDAPTRYTPPLSEDFPSDGPKVRKLVELVWKTPEQPEGITLDPFQEDLIDHVLERYPEDHPDPNLAGRLRYRQVLISMARQNSKSVIGAILALYGLLMHEKGPIVISLASNVDQARIIYNRLMYVIKNNPGLAKRFQRTTETRGIELNGGAGKYEVKASKGAAIQGIPVSMGLVDELHIVKPELWSGMVLGSSTRQDGLVVGITTAGDDNSILLKDLYKQAEEAIAGNNERFGAFIWEAPEGADITDEQAIIAANPAIATGRVSLENAVNDIKTLPEDEARRYRHNRFVASMSSWLPMELWRKSIGEPVVGTTPPGRPVFTVDRTPAWEHATITATIKGEKTYTEVVASIVKPTLEQLTRLCVELNRHAPITFAMDGYTLSDLHQELTRRGIPSKRLNLTDVTNACSTAYALIAQGRVVHQDEPLLRRQMPFAIKKNAGDAWRISRQASSHDIDAVMSMVFGLYVAQTSQDAPAQVF